MPQNYYNDFSIIPLNKNRKTPAVTWGEYQQRKPTPEEVESWHIEQNSYNIGVVTGAISRIVVIDVDGPDGESSLEQIGIDTVCPTVKTPRGRHLYFKHPGYKVPNAVGAMKGVDIRGDGGYVVAPPSKNEEGIDYTWSIRLDEAELPDLPFEILHLLNSEPKQADTLSSCLNSELPRSVRSEINRLFGELSQAEEGSRNDCLNKTAFSIGSYVGAGAIDRSWAEESLNKLGLQMGLDGAEAKATVQSGLNAGVQNPKELTLASYAILDDVPETLDRPLRLIGERSYGVTWLPLSKSDENTGSRTRLELVVFDADGSFYSDLDIPGSKPIDDLGIVIHLPHQPQQTKLLSPSAFKAFVRGYRPNPAEIFSRICRCVDAFVSFEGSWADQQTMSEIVSCWIIGTYLLDASSVIGYLWPGGERASGKTQFLNTVSNLAYLGRTITSGGSFASIRDEADYGATLGFDDCENVRELDQNKRELLLAGNTKGTVIPLKELVGEGQWQTRYVNNFAPRLFSSIELPDDVLASRVISIPLVASSDKSKTRRSPEVEKDWPHSRRALIDNLWLIGVLYLPAMEIYDRLACEASPLEARNHDIWRIQLAVAKWLEQEHGISQLFERMNQASIDYQSSNIEYRGTDDIALTLQAAYQVC